MTTLERNVNKIKQKCKELHEAYQYRQIMFHNQYTTKNQVKDFVKNIKNLF